MCEIVELDTAFKYTDVLFHGRVKEIVRQKFWTYQGWSAEIVNFEVIEGYKKSKKDDGLISIINYNSSCQFFFELGEEYVVFGYDIGGGHYSTNICAKTDNIINFDKKVIDRIKYLSSIQKENLYNYSNALIIDKPQYDAIRNRNDELQADLFSLERKLYLYKILLFAMVGLLIVYVIYVTLIKRPSS